VTTRTAKAGSISRRMLAVAAVAAITLSLALTMRVALANDLNQDPGQDGISWDDPAFQGSDEDCANAGLEPGQVLWHFIHTGTDSSDLPSELTAEFADAGVVKADGFVNGNSVVMYNIITDQDSLLSASDDIQNDGNLNLSHICSNSEEQSVAESASEAESVAESVAESASGEQSVEAGTGTPEESQSDGALSLSGAGAIPTIAFSLILLASLGALAYANVKSVRNIS
jgi:hypothetical protein